MPRPVAAVVRSRSRDSAPAKPPQPPPAVPALVAAARGRETRATAPLPPPPLPLPSLLPRAPLSPTAADSDADSPGPCASGSTLVALVVIEEDARPQPVPLRDVYLALNALVCWGVAAGLHAFVTARATASVAAGGAAAAAVAAFPDAGQRLLAPGSSRAAAWLPGTLVCGLMLAAACAPAQRAGCAAVRDWLWGHAAVLTLSSACLALTHLPPPPPGPGCARIVSAPTAAAWLAVLCLLRLLGAGGGARLPRGVQTALLAAGLAAPLASVAARAEYSYEALLGLAAATGAFAALAGRADACTAAAVVGAGGYW